MADLNTLRKALQRAAEAYLDHKSGDSEPELYCSWKAAQCAYEEAIKEPPCES